MQPRGGFLRMCCTKQRMRALFGFPDSEAHQAGEGTRVPLLNLKVVNDNLAPPLSKGRLGGVKIYASTLTDLCHRSLIEGREPEIAVEL